MVPFDEDLHRAGTVVDAPSSILIGTSRSVRWASALPSRSVKAWEMPAQSFPVQSALIHWATHCINILRSSCISLYLPLGEIQRGVSRSVKYCAQNSSRVLAAARADAGLVVAVVVCQNVALRIRGGVGEAQDIPGSGE